ncbi:MAG: cyclodeaminase/cyclohydrolase family protein [Oscillospiraceae bacterium]|nr:cyclodeaminase/cyclohydrolase family protein [Oscillospiraceae bacterium]
MAEKIVIEIFKEKNAEEFTAALASPDCRASAGSAAAYTAAMACALAERAAKLCTAANGENERLSYIERNCEILRSYMVNLIDEDVKSKRPHARALKEGGAREIEATLQTAGCIDAEIVNMMLPCLQFLDELCALCPAEERHFIREAAELAMSATRVAQSVIFFYSEKSSDETYRYVTRRENEIFLSERTALYESILSKL